MAKKHSKRVPQLRSRQTRSSKGRRLLSDPAESTQALNQQLAALGLYAVQTLGDGNCLFRSLSDQYYGSDSRHALVRNDICDWIAKHQPRYAPFVDDDRGIEEHLRCMSENATYGGHMELSAFAHLTRRNIKVIQPGLVYVIEWNAGGDPEDFQEDKDSADDNPTDARERRRQRRERIKEKKQAVSVQIENDQDDSSEHSTMYVAYHDWEHFSSIRNLRGPHTGLPCVEEAPAPTSTEAASCPSPPLKHAQKYNVKRVKLKLGPQASPSKPSSPKSASPSKSSPSKDTSPRQGFSPLAVPLPSSRSSSPTPSVSALPSLSPSPVPYPPLYAQPGASSAPRVTRSPKRNFDESSSFPRAEDGDEYGSEGGTKRPRVGPHARSDKTRMAKLKKEAEPEHLDNGEMNVDDGDASEDGDAPSIHVSPPKSTASVTSEASSTSSPSSSPSPPPSSSFNKQNRVPEQVKQIQRRRERGIERPLTRRQKKAMSLTADKKNKVAGVIVIPSGKTRAGAVNAREDAAIDKGEWLMNGSGRVDVRGFRELRI